MSSKKVLMVALALLLAGTTAVWAGASGKQAKAAQTRAAAPMKTHVVSGKIVSINDSTLVLASAKKGKAEDTTFVLNSSTQRKGDLKEGAKASVHYRVENSEKVATMVQARGARQAAPSSKSEASRKKS